MKKLLCIVLSALCVLALFTGCEQKPAENPTDASLPELSETEATGSTPQAATSADPTEATAAEEQGIHYKGLTSYDVTPEILEETEGRPMDAETKAGEDTMYIYNNVEYCGITYTQLQCILFGERTTITLTYKLSEGETTETAMKTISDTITPLFGEPSVSTSGTASNTWRAAKVNDNSINLYVLNDTELKLCFTLY